MFLNSNTSLSMYLFCNSRIHVITLYLGHVRVYYMSMLRCWHLVWILVRTDYPCLGVGCHKEGRCGQGWHKGAREKAASGLTQGHERTAPGPTHPNMRGQR
jgi:hypothetical protein